MSDIPSAPLPGLFSPEEAESTITFRIYLTTINFEALRDCSFHLGSCSGGVCIDIGTDAMTSVHDEGASVHAGLGSVDKIQMVRPTSPSSVDESLGMEDGFEVLPLASVSMRRSMSTYPRICVKEGSYLYNGHPSASSLSL